MLEILPESQGNILWVRARGKLTDRDYREVFIPRLEAIIQEHGKVRLLFYLDPDFDGWSVGALWEDLKLDWKHQSDFEKIAVVGAPRWAEVVTKIFARFMAGEVRTMLREQLAEAWEWLQGKDALRQYRVD
ncbi:MAG: STAS/SEC14 domain-containing protein [Desulfobaccales bacterium]